MECRHFLHHNLYPTSLQEFEAKIIEIQWNFYEKLKVNKPKSSATIRRTCLGRLGTDFVSLIVITSVTIKPAVIRAIRQQTIAPTTILITIFFMNLLF
jgi:hypothetical protein